MGCAEVSEGLAGRLPFDGWERSAMSHPQPGSAGHDKATTPPTLSQKVRKDGAASVKIPAGKGWASP